MRNQWDEWMMSKWEQITAADNTPKPTRRIVSEWVLAAYDEFSPHVIRNSWTKKGYAWFDKRTEDPEVVIVEAEDEDEFVVRMLWDVNGDNDNDDDDEDDNDDDDDNEDNTVANVNNNIDGNVKAI